jgi:hypothetical protein
MLGTNICSFTVLARSIVSASACSRMAAQCRSRAATVTERTTGEIRTKCTIPPVSSLDACAETTPEGSDSSD